MITGIEDRRVQQEVYDKLVSHGAARRVELAGLVSQVTGGDRGVAWRRGVIRGA